MQFQSLIVVVAALTFGYVLVRFSSAMFGAGMRDRRLGQGGVAFALGVPALLLSPRTTDIPGDELRALVIGSALWVTLALAFAAFAVSQMAHRRTV